MYRKINAAIIDHCSVSVANIKGGDEPGSVPLSLYSVGSSFRALMLNDEDALESA